MTDKAKTEIRDRPDEDDGRYLTREEVAQAVEVEIAAFYAPERSNGLGPHETGVAWIIAGVLIRLFPLTK